MKYEVMKYEKNRRMGKRRKRERERNENETSV